MEISEGDYIRSLNDEDLVDYILDFHYHASVYRMSDNKRQKMINNMKEPQQKGKRFYGI